MGRMQVRLLFSSNIFGRQESITQFSPKSEK